MSEERHKIKLTPPRYKRLAKFLDVSEEKARKLLRKYSGSRIHWSGVPPPPEEADKAYFRLIEREEFIENNENPYEKMLIRAHWSRVMENIVEKWNNGDHL